MKSNVLTSVLVVVFFLLTIFTYEASYHFETNVWLFALLIVLFFAVFLVIWHKFNLTNWLVPLTTIVTLLMINSVFLYLLPDIYIVVFSLLTALVLLPLYRHHKDAVIASLGAVVVNLVLLMELSNLPSSWILVLISGALVFLGWKKGYPVVLRLYAILALLNIIYLTIYLSV